MSERVVDEEAGGIATVLGGTEAEIGDGGLPGETCDEDALGVFGGELAAAGGGTGLE